MFKLDLKNRNFYVAIDFDKTITSEESIDSWAASANPSIVPKELCIKMDELYDKYRPIEINYDIPKDEKNKLMKEWYVYCMDLYYQYKLTKVQLEESINKSDLKLRNGAKEFLELMYKNDIPVIILSAGIGNVISKYLKSENCFFDNMYIISNFIQFDEKGDMQKFDNSKIIHTLNKNMEGHLPIKYHEKIKNKKYRLLLGDLIEDIKMVNENELSNTIKIAFLNRNQEECYKIYKEKFDIVLQKENATFRKVIDLVF